MGFDARSCIKCIEANPSADASQLVEKLLEPGDDAPPKSRTKSDAGASTVENNAADSKQDIDCVSSNGQLDIDKRKQHLASFTTEENQVHCYEDGSNCQ